MNNFIQNLVARHQGATPSVQPRTRGRFEPVSNQSDSFSPSNPNLGMEMNAQEVQTDSPLPIRSKPGRSVDTPGALNKEVKTEVSDQSRFESPSDRKEGLLTDISSRSPVPPLFRKEDTNSKIGGQLKTYADQPQQSDQPQPLDRVSVVNPSTEIKSIKGQNREVDPPSMPIVTQQDPSEKSLLIDPLPTVAKIFEKTTDGPPVFSRQTQVPTIKVNIGRIEVRAQKQAPIPAPARKSTPNQPKMSLEDYLNKKNNRSR